MIIINFLISHPVPRTMNNEATSGKTVAIAEMSSSNQSPTASVPGYDLFLFLVINEQIEKLSQLQLVINQTQSVSFNVILTPFHMIRLLNARLKHKSKMHV